MEAFDLHSLVYLANRRCKGRYVSQESRVDPERRKVMPSFFSLPGRRRATLFLALSILAFADPARPGTDALPEIDSPPIALNGADAGPGATPSSNAMASGHGFAIKQSGPTEGTSPGPLFFNSIFSSFTSKVTSTNEPGRPGCACVSGFHTTLAVGGNNLDATELYGASFGISHRMADDSSADKVGLSAGAYSNKHSPGKVYGSSSGVTLDNGGSTPQLVGLEVDSEVKTGGSVPYRIGLNVWNGGEGLGSSLDTAYAVSNSGAPAAARGAWKKLFSLYTQGGTLNPALAKDADFFYSDSDATVANIFNLPNVKVTGDILKFPSATLTGSGALKVASMKAYSSPSPAGKGEISYGGATAPASKCGSLQGSTGCVVINIAGEQHYIPYW